MFGASKSGDLALKAWQRFRFSSKLENCILLCFKIWNTNFGSRVSTGFHVLSPRLDFEVVLINNVANLILRTVNVYC